MHEDKETNIVNQVPSWHYTVRLKCNNKYLSTYFYYKIYTYTQNITYTQTC